MFHKKFINHRKKLLHLLKLKSISEKDLFNRDLNCVCLVQEVGF